MLVDFAAALDDVYASLGVDAVLVPVGTGAPNLALVVVDHSSGVEVKGGRSGMHAGGMLAVGTIEPCADVRMRELLAALAGAGLALADLAQATITFSGRAWRIKSHYPKGSPQGEDFGERRFVLIAA